MIRLATISVIALVACASVDAATRAHSASRSVDRTLLCATEPSGGVYEIEARSHQGTRSLESGSPWLKLPFAAVSTGRIVGNVGKSFLDNSFVWITAGKPAASTTTGQEFEVTPVLPNGTVGINRRRCRPTGARVPLTAAGLQGGLASQLQDSVDCASPRRVLVRVHVVFERPTTLRGRGIFHRTTKPTQAARVAVRTESGKALVYADVAASGKARLFTAKGCVPD